MSARCAATASKVVSRAVAFRAGPRATLLRSASAVAAATDASDVGTVRHGCCARVGAVRHSSALPGSLFFVPATNATAAARRRHMATGTQAAGDDGAVGSQPEDSAQGGPRARGRPRLWSPAVHKPLNRINAMVDDALTQLKLDSPGAVSPALWDVCIDAVLDIHRAQSKQLVRPQLVLLGGAHDTPVHVGLRGSGDGDVADEGGPEPATQAALEKFAAGLELQHLFMMVHDDVIDNATMRRGLPPVHLAARQRRGRTGGVRQAASYHLATIIGDVLYTKAVSLMHEASVEAGAPHALTTVLSDGIRTGFGQFCDIVGWGELQARGFGGGAAMDAVGDVLLDKSGRTAMCSPLLAGMHLAGASEASMEIARTWGKHAGVAMQAIDDVADLVVEQTTTGKDSFQDFRDQRLTVLLFLLWDRAGESADWQEVTALWRGLSPTRGSGDYSALLPHERRSLMHMLERHGVVPAAFEYARHQLHQAEAVLTQLPADQTLAVGLQRFLHGMRAHATALEGVIAEEAEEHGYLPT